MRVQGGLFDGEVVRAANRIGAEGAADYPGVRVSGREIIICWN